MVQLTIALEEQVLERARQKAHEQGVSLDEILRRYLESYAVDPMQEQKQAIRGLLDLSMKAQGGSGGRTWTRDELHQMRIEGVVIENPFQKSEITLSPGP